MTDEHHMDTDGAHDRAERRRELKRQFHHASKALARVLADVPLLSMTQAQYERYVELRDGFSEAYVAWRNCH